LVRQPLLLRVKVYRLLYGLIIPPDSTVSGKAELCNQELQVIAANTQYFKGQKAGLGQIALSLHSIYSLYNTVCAYKGLKDDPIS
jgi:hypothetical protein